VHEGEHADFLTVEFLLDEDARTGVPVCAADHESVNRAKRLSGLVGHDHPFTSGQPICLDNDGPPAAADERSGICGIVEGSKWRGGDARAAHEILGKHFAGFYLGRALRGTECE
jgi:hypothetical protein